MSANLVGIIVCVAMVVCGIGCYFIGRLHGVEWVLENTRIEVADDESGSDQGEG